MQLGDQTSGFRLVQSLIASGKSNCRFGATECVLRLYNFLLFGDLYWHQAALQIARCQHSPIFHSESNNTQVTHYSLLFSLLLALSLLYDTILKSVLVIFFVFLFILAEMVCCWAVGAQLIVPMATICTDFQQIHLCEQFEYRKRDDESYIPML